MNFDACFFYKKNLFSRVFFFIYSVMLDFKGIQKVYARAELLINMFIFFIVNE